MKELITAALPYANGELHLGHLMSTYLPADEYSRYCKLVGRESLFVCATDEHGAPIQFKAEQAGIEPEEFVKRFRKKHAKDFAKMGVEFDCFYYTHSPENHELTKEFYETLNEKGLFEERLIQQTYCPKCDRVLPDRYVKGKCPFCGAEEQYGDSCESCGKAYSTTDLIEPKCSVCGAVPERQESKHLFFKLSEFKPFLEEWLAKPELQSDVVNYVKNWLSDLKDWDVTRDGPYFGIPIPGRKNQFFYVWFDAPIGYASSTLAWCKANNAQLSDWWQNEDCRITHFIGKDIVYHHYLFWPTMLHARGYSIPARIPTRGHLNMAGQKMSKSRGRFILLEDIKLPSDYVRYYLTAITPNSTADVNFTWDELKEKVNKELVDAYGNFVHRSLSFIVNKEGGVVPAKGESTEEDNAFERETDELLARVAKQYDAVDFKRALEECMAFAGKANKYFNDRAPWKLIKESPGQAQTVLYNSTRAVYALSIALNPILPESTARALSMLGLEAKWDANAFQPKELKGVAPLFEKIQDD